MVVGWARGAGGAGRFGRGRGRGGLPARGATRAPSRVARRSAGGGRELPVVGRDRRLLERGRPGGRPAGGRGPVRSRRPLCREQRPAGGGGLPPRGGAPARGTPRGGRAPAPRPPGPRGPACP